MGLRFRKSISIVPGVKLNLGKTGMSISTGVPGFRKTFHTSGKVTTSVGIPGTGIYYVDTKNLHESNSGNYTSVTQKQNDVDVLSEATIEHQSLLTNEHDMSDLCISSSQIDINTLKSIHKASDDSIDWTEVLVSPSPPDSTYNQQMWEYYHSIAPEILSGNIDAYLRLIFEVNPLDDLLAYGGNYEFGTDDPQRIEVEFVVNQLALTSAKSQVNNDEYNDLLQDYICSVCIRIARDMFALLPVSNTIVHAVIDDITVISVDFDRASLSKVKFGFIDPSDTLSKFRHNMNFSVQNGFASVRRIT